MSKELSVIDNPYTMNINWDCCYGFSLSASAVAMRLYAESAKSAKRYADYHFCLDGKNYEISHSLLVELLAPYQVEVES